MSGQSKFEILMETINICDQIKASFECSFNLPREELKDDSFISTFWNGESSNIRLEQQGERSEKDVEAALELFSLQYHDVFRQHLHYLSYINVDQFEDLEDSDSESESAKGRADFHSKRNRFILNKVFEKRMFLTPEERERLASYLDLKGRQVTVWFQNSRSRNKRLNGSAIRERGECSNHQQAAQNEPQVHQQADAGNNHSIFDNYHLIGEPFEPPHEPIDFTMHSLTETTNVDNTFTVPTMWNIPYDYIPPSPILSQEPAYSQQVVSFPSSMTYTQPQ